MTLTAQEQERLRSDIVDHCVAIERLFKLGAKVTVIVRNPHVPGDADVLVTSDTLPEIVSAIQLRIEKEAVEQAAQKAGIVGGGRS